MPANIVVPEVGESIVDARVAKWLRQEGDVVAAGDPLVELETDKIDLEVSAPQAGVLGRIARKDGEDVKVGELLGVIEDAAAGAGAPKAAAPAATAGQPQAPAAVSTPGKAPRATPTARKAAEEHAVDLSAVRGSGDAGRVMRRDVEKAVRGGAASPAAAVPAAAPPAVEPPAPKPAPPVAEKPRTAPGDRTEERIRML